MQQRHKAQAESKRFMTYSHLCHLYYFSGNVVHLPSNNSLQSAAWTFIFPVSPTSLLCKGAKSKILSNKWRREQMGKKNPKAFQWPGQGHRRSVQQKSGMKAPVVSRCYSEAVKECFAQQNILTARTSTDLEVGWAADAFWCQSREGPACERKQVLALLGRAGA